MRGCSIHPGCCLIPEGYSQNQLPCSPSLLPHCQRDSRSPMQPSERTPTSYQILYNGRSRRLYDVLTTAMETQSRSFFNIVSRMTKRNELKRKVEGMNLKAYARALPWRARITYELYNHKKKLLFFAVVGGLLYYYGYFGKTVRWFRNMEPFRNRVDRWFLGRNNKLLGETLKQQDIADITLEESSQERLLEVYLMLDKELPMGIGRGTLFETFDQYGLMWSEDRIQEYWRETGYFRERNQKVAGCTAREFLKLLQFSIRKLREFNPHLSEAQLVTDFISKLVQDIPRLKKDQQRLIKDRRSEYQKVIKQDQFKEQFLNEVEAEKSSLRPEDLDTLLRQNGLHGLSVKDHHQIVTTRIIEKTLQKHILEKKMSSLYKQHKHLKYRRRIEDLNKVLEELGETQKELEKEYKKYYGSSIF